MSTTPIPSLTLNDGHTIPQLGFGGDQIPPEQTEAAVVNQIELQPFLQQERLRAYHREHGIVTESWSHLAEAEVEVLFPVIADIAERHNVNATRVALAWNLQLGNVALSASVAPEGIRGNLEAVSLRLSDEEMDAIAGLDRGERVGPDPVRFS
ncbi:MAG TPA: aldo/keto reductase [Streptosporangiaceae bacterium]|nr:aldo/keto reductase [Streptosporangiaceae bacterium]